jgi:O-methyltransferase
MGYNVQETIAVSELLLQTAGVGMQDFSRLVHLCHYALSVQWVEGEYVEFGCFRGDTAKLLTRITGRRFHLYDSFLGLPDVGESCVAGAMKCRVEEVCKNFTRDGITKPVIHEGWFADLKEIDLPDKISFCHIDGDLYSSTIQALRLVYPRMAKGGVILVDDYGEPYFEGPKRAVDEFFRDTKEIVRPLAGMNGFSAYKALVCVSQN